MVDAGAIPGISPRQRMLFSATTLAMLRNPPPLAGVLHRANVHFAGHSGVRNFLSTKPILTLPRHSATPTRVAQVAPIERYAW